jgi:hypothetical protein
MENCPKCKRLSLEYDPVRSEQRCLWRACGYVRLANSGFKGPARATRAAEPGSASPRGADAETQRLLAT